MNTDITYYTITGKADYYDEDENPCQEEENKVTYAYRKYLPTRQKWVYYIRVNSEGKLINPNGLYDEHLSKKPIRAMAKPSFVEVIPKVFQYYLSFLKSKNPSYLLNAERQR